MPTSRRPRARRRAAAGRDQPLPALQERSRETTERLLAAATDLLRAGGADAATLRHIADRAGVSLAIVYRRFADKDAVLRAVYTAYFTGVAQGNARVLSSDRLRKASLAELAHILAGAIARGYRRDRDLLRALVLYARQHRDAGFRERAASLNESALAGIRELVESHRTEIRHPNPAIAIAFALNALASILADQILFGDDRPSAGLSHAQLTSEATRLFLAYLTTSHDAAKGASST